MKVSNPEKCLFFLRLMKGRKFLKDDSKAMADYQITESMKIKVVIRLVTFRFLFERKA